jgi:hypothetical protein
MWPTLFIKLRNPGSHRRRSLSPDCRRPPLRPPRRRPLIEQLEDRTVSTIDLLSSFPGINFADSGPADRGQHSPDPIGAAGPNHVVQIVNSAIAIYDKSTGAQLSQKSLQEFFAPVLAQVPASFSRGEPRIGDPVVSYDEQAGRFFVGALDFGRAIFSGTDSFFYFAVSNTANPLDGFTEMHRIDVKRVVTIGGVLTPTVADFPRFGWNADAYVFSFNMVRFPFPAGAYSHVQVLSIDKSTVLDADPNTLTKYQVDRPGPSNVNMYQTPAVMHDSRPGDPMWFVTEAGANNGTTLRVVRMTNVLSATPTFTDFNIPVDPYGGVPSMATQPGGGLIDTNTSYIVNAAWRNDRLVAAHTANAGGAAAARWYEFDIPEHGDEEGGPPPFLAQSGVINPGPGVSTYYPTVEIAANGDLGMTFLQSSPTEYPSMYVTGRQVTDPPGVMRPPVLVKAGEAPWVTARPSPHEGTDFSGITVDPVTGTSFWAVHAYASAAPTLTNWATWVGQFAVSEPAGAWVIATSPGEVVVGSSVSSLTVTFNEPMDTSSFRLTADVVSFTGPDGVDLRKQLLKEGNFHWSPDGRGLTISFPAQSASGSYSLVLGPHIQAARKPPR